MSHFNKKVTALILLLVLCFLGSSVLPVLSSSSLTAPKLESGRRLIFEQDFEDKRTANWKTSVGYPELRELDGNTVYNVKGFDYVDFTNVKKMVNFRFEFNMMIKISDPENACPAFYVKSQSDTQRYEIVFKRSEKRNPKGKEFVTLRRNGTDTISIPMEFNAFNEKWVYIRIDVNNGIIKLYFNNNSKPILTYEDPVPLVSGSLGFARGECDYFYLDNLLVSADKVPNGEYDTAFTGITVTAPRSPSVYGETLVDWDASSQNESPFSGGQLISGADGQGLFVDGRAEVGDSSWTNYSLEIDMTLLGKKPIGSTQPFLYFRYIDDRNFYSLSSNLAGSSLVVRKMVNGSSVWVSEKVFFSGPNRKLQLRIDIYGNRFNIYARSKSYPNFEFPNMFITSDGPNRGGVVVNKINSLDGILVSSIKAREIKELGSVGPRPDPEPLVEVFENPAPSWRDIQNHWAAAELTSLAGAGIIIGFPDCTFRPDATLQVNEFIKMLAVAAGWEIERDETNWASSYIQAAISNGVMIDGDFDRYDRPITRKEIVNLIIALLGEEKESALEKAADLGIIVRDEQGSLNEDATATRAEAAVMLARLLYPVYRPAENTVLVTLKESDKAFANPYKGFRGGWREIYATLRHNNIYWNQIENNESDGVDKIIEYTDELLKDYPKYNTKAILRVVLEVPPNTYWPADMKTLDYTSQKFCDRIDSLVKKLAQAWDFDPRIAYIHMGIVGKWGEMQSPYPSLDVAKALDKAFSQYFTNKLVMTNIVLQGGMFPDTTYGSYWDSFGHWGNLPILDLFEDPDYKDSWKIAPRGGEVAFDWGEMLGVTPNEAVINHKDRYVELFRATHCNYIGWISGYDKGDPVATRNAIDMQKALGYRFVPDAVRYTRRAEPGGTIDVMFNVKNTGSSPVYYNMPLEVSLLDSETRQPVWSANFPNLDIRTWLPDDDYSCQPLYNAAAQFELPPDLPVGEYILSFAVLDPEGGNLPSLRFAIDQYFKGGRHPIGKIGIGKDVVDPFLSSDLFDDIVSDKLYYIYER